MWVVTVKRQPTNIWAVQIKKRRHGERQRIQTAFNGGVESLRARIHKQNKERAEQM